MYSSFFPPVWYNKFNLYWTRWARNNFSLQLHSCLFDHLNICFFFYSSKKRGTLEGKEEDASIDPDSETEFGDDVDAWSAAVNYNIAFNDPPTDRSPPRKVRRIRPDSYFSDEESFDDD